MVGHDGFGAWRRRHPAAVDAATVALVLATFEMPAFDPYRHDGGAWWAVWGLLLACPLLVRRRAPTSVTAVCTMGAVGALVTRSGPNWGILSQVIILLGPAVALASAATSLAPAASRRLALASVAVVLAANAASRSSPDAAIAQVAFVAGAWLTGEAVRARRHEVALLRELVARRAEQAAATERARIARELHDVVAHHLSVIAIQAGAARIAAETAAPAALAARAAPAPAAPAAPTPAPAAASYETLAIIEEASRQALADLRRALGVLRAEDATSGLRPQPRLDELAPLADRLREAGLPLRLTTTGDLADIPGGVATSVYRIVQEALTNVMNHAGAVATTVRVACTPEEVELEVRNAAPHAAPGSMSVGPDGGGHGLVGMRERVAAYGGSLHTGALPSGGYRVTARIPLP
jgi:signal transduction histidine kinase